MVFKSPVIASDGFTYDEPMLLRLLKDRQRSPMTREVLTSHYRVAHQKRREVEDFLQRRAQELLAFAQDAAPSQPSLVLAALERITGYVVALGASGPRELVAGAVKVYRNLHHSIPPELEQLVVVSL
jgi:hypothetical protein